MTDATGDDRLDRIERGLDLLFTAEVTKEIAEAVDVEAILADEPAEDPIDVERLGEAVGRPVGRLLVHRAVGGSGAVGLAKRTVGSEVGERIAARTFRVAVEHVDTGRVVEALVELDEEALPGPALQEVLGPHVEDGDAPAVDGHENVDEADAGGDATGVHDAAGDNRTGVLDGTGSDGVAEAETDETGPDGDGEGVDDRDATREK